MFQFTHPGGVRLLSRPKEEYVTAVSIHAPGRGATWLRAFVILTAIVSIHAPGRGATLTAIPRVQTPLSFNSRTREGCDSLQAILPVSSLPFQFTHPGGVRLKLLSFQGLNIMVSIHAPGRGATEREPSGASLPASFNSRTREGCDEADIASTEASTVSIHAPGRGATYRT